MPLPAGSRPLLALGAVVGGHGDDAFAVGGNFHFQLIQHHVGQLAVSVQQDGGGDGMDGAGAGLVGGLGQDAEAGLPAAGLGGAGAADEPDMAFELLMLPESLLPLRQPDSSSAAATAQLRRAFCLCVISVTLPFISLGVV